MSAEKPEPPHRFGPFRIDTDNEQLWRHQESVPLKPKAFAVLQHLVERHGKLVTKRELFTKIWPDTAVSDGVLTTCIKEIRKALSDAAKAPRFIETVHRRGYRFIATPTPAGRAGDGQTRGRRGQPSEPAKLPAAHSPATQRSLFVGRGPELERLADWFGRALHGTRQVVFISGEAGIGKTSVVEAFLDRLAAADKPLVLRGQCVEQYGAGEAYLPVLDALGRLCRLHRGEFLLEALLRYAPTWLAQLPWLLSDATLEDVQRRILGASQERMLREMAEGLEALTQEHPVIVWLDDLHWSDPSTLDLLAFLAKRQEAARLLVIGTYRPVDAIISQHPLRSVQRELQLHGQCEELVLDYLSETDVQAYLADRCSQTVLPQRLAGLIHQRTDGNPLFMVSVVDALAAAGLLADSGQVRSLQEIEAAVTGSLAGSLQGFIERQIERLDTEERAVLEAASIAGVEFVVSAVAAGLEKDEEDVEDVCARLATRQQFLRDESGREWPDGTLGTRYRFIHAVYQEVFYAGLPRSRRTRLHQRVGEHLEACQGDRTTEAAAELASHFERGDDLLRAVSYYRQAGENALRRHGYQEAIAQCQHGLALLKKLPPGLTRDQYEVGLCLTLGPALIATKGHAVPELEQVYLNARTLCQELGEPDLLFPVLWGLMAQYLLRAQLGRARSLGEQLLRLAGTRHEPALLLEASLGQGSALLWSGQLELGSRHFERAMDLYDAAQHRSHAFVYGQDPGVVCQIQAAFTLWLRGYPDRAMKLSQEALRLAQDTEHPYTLAYGLNWMAMVHQFCRAADEVRRWAEASLAVSGKNGFAHLTAVATVLHGWALVEQGHRQEGLAQSREGIAMSEAGETVLLRPYYLGLLAAGYAKQGDTAQGLRLLNEALELIEQTGEEWWAAELWRTKGILLQNQGISSGGKTEQAGHVEECLMQARTLAHRQQAKALELRAAIDLGRLWHTQGKKDRARTTVAEVYKWFTEGRDTRDLKDAQALLHVLS